MKIGITTIHRICNYGSALQAYALQRCVRGMGYDCEVIDYIYPNEYHQKKRSSITHLKSSILRSTKNYIIDVLTKRNVREYKFAEFISDNVFVSSRCYETKEDIQEEPPLYDAYITGSDQVWNPRYMHDDSTFLLSFAPLYARRIAYAASFGNSVLDPKYYSVYKKYIELFHSISVRESQGVDIVSKLIGKKPCHVLDPTMLLSAAEWGKLALAPNQQRKYILCYFLGYAFNPFPYVYELAEYYQRLTGYEIVYLNPSIKKNISPSSRAVYDAGPLEFLGWIANAEIVLTTSFHGTAFAANYNRPFLSIIDKDYLDCRQSSFVEMLELQSHLLKINSAFPDPYSIVENYTSLNKHLQHYRNESIEFLRIACMS